MDIIVTVVTGLLIFIAAGFSTILGAFYGLPKSVSERQVNDTYTSAWLFWLIGSSAVATTLLWINNGWIGLGIWLVVGFTVGNVVERVTWTRLSPEHAEAWVEKMLARKQRREKEALQRKQRQDEAERKQIEERLANIAQGTFTVGLRGEKVNLGDAFCYLYDNGPGMRLAGKKADKERIHITDTGIDLGRRVCYRSQTTSSLTVHGMSAASLISGALATETIKISISWQDLRNCIVNTIKESEYHFLFYQNAAKNRNEWIAVFLL